MAVHVDQLPGSASLLPAWTSALAVVAHPDDESFALGAVLSAFVRSGCQVSVLCLTRGEASTVHGISGDLRALRAMELRDAAAVLGLSAAELSDHPDGELGRVSRAALVREVRESALRAGAQGLVVFDDSGVTGHSDHIAASEAALDAATELGLPVLGWTLPLEVAEQLNAEFASTFTGHQPTEVDLTVPVERDKQRTASLAHASQAVPTSVLWRRLELLGDVEHLRWLRPPVESSQAVTAAATQVPAATTDDATMRVDYRDGDRFDIRIRDHVVTVDQPTDVGGDDAGPTPTELFVAGLASCVAFYARRYLRRHKLDASGPRRVTAPSTTPSPLRPRSPSVTDPGSRVVGRRLGWTGRWTRLARLGPSVLAVVGSG
jgi:LmbE family N-acetylglucosaminyl deacetylase